MKKHILNLFKVQNLSKIDFSYKLIVIELPSIFEEVENEKEKFRVLWNVLNKIKSSLQCPVALVFKNENYCLAIPANKEFSSTKIPINKRPIQLIAKDRFYTARHKSERKEDKEIVFKFLDFCIRQQIGDTFKLDLFTEGTHNFYLKKPKFKKHDSEVEIYEGFTFRLIEGDDEDYYLALDLRNKYIEKSYLAQLLWRTNKTQLIKKIRGRKCLYQNGDNWYSASINGFGKEISKEEIEKDGNFISVYDYINGTVKNPSFPITKCLKPEQTCLFYTYPGRKEKVFKGATTFAKIILKTDDPRVAPLHRQSVLKPKPRLTGIKRTIKRVFQNLSFEGNPIEVSKTPTKEQLGCFPLPALKYKDGFILAVDEYDLDGNIVREDDYPKFRKRLIQQKGILANTSYDTQILVVPNSWDDLQIEAFKKDIESLLKSLSPNHTGFHKVVSWEYDNYFESASEQVKLIESAFKEAGVESGYALFILPDEARKYRSYVKNFHDCLKRKFFKDIKFQCASATKIARYYEIVENPKNPQLIEKRPSFRQKGRFNSYLFNLALEFLNLNRKWAFALANNLHYDIYMGIDVHGNYIGLSFFFKNGEKLFFHHIETERKPNKKRNEKVFANDICDVIIGKLRHFIKKFDLDPNGIVVVRDGMSFGEETNALERVIDALNLEGLVDKKSLKWGVVDVHKKSAIPHRAFLPTDSFQEFDNPKAGTYKIYKKRKLGFLYNTGYPFENAGSATALQVLFQDGNLDYEKVMQDLFDQSMMALSAPDRSNSLPVVLKIIDTFLGHAGASFDEEKSNEVKKDKVTQAKLFTNN